MRLTKKILSGILVGAVAFAATFNISPATTAQAGTKDVKYVMMNVPYNDFYAAYELTDKAVWEVEKGVDAVSTATTSKFAGTTGLANGTYNDGKYIKGVSIPVQVSAEDYAKLTAGKVEESALGTAADYSFADLTETPTAYSTLSVGTDNKKTFSKFGESKVTTGSLSIGEMTTSGSYGDFQISLLGVTTTKKVEDNNYNTEGKKLIKSGNGNSDVEYNAIYGAVIKTQGNKSYGMTTLENLWFGAKVANVEIAWSIKEGAGKTNHGGEEFYQFEGMNGATITGVDLITDLGVISINQFGDKEPYTDNLKLASYYAGDLSALALKATADESAIAISGIPAELKDVKVNVTAGRTSVATNAEVADGKVALTQAVADGTTYSVTINSSNYGPIVKTVATVISEAQKAELNSLVEAAKKTTRYASNDDLKEHVGEAEEMVSRGTATSVEANSLIAELQEKIKETYPTAQATATLKGSELVITLTGAELSNLTNPKLTLSAGSGRSVTKLVDGVALTSLTQTLEVEPTVGTEYTLTIVSDNYQDITTKVTAEAASTTTEEEKKDTAQETEKNTDNNTNNSTNNSTNTSQTNTAQTKADNSSTTNSDKTSADNTTKKTEKTEQKITGVKTKIKAKKKAKKKQTFKLGGKAKGKLTYKIFGKTKAKIKVSKTGKLTVPAKTKKGTYKIKVKITAKATEKYAAKTVTKTIKVVVK